MRILILHAYSSRNRGDGLLVDESIEMARILYGDNLEICVIAIDATSFDYLENILVKQLPIAQEGFLKRLRALFSMLIKPSSLGFVEWSPSEWLKQGGIDSKIMAVGGGYMRSTSFFQSLKFLLAHGSQLAWAIRQQEPRVYLPQSVGPFRCLGGLWLKRRLRELPLLCLRDDRSVEQLGETRGVFRCPDLAVLRIAQEGVPNIKREQSGPVAIVLRDLSCEKSVKKSYIDKCKKLVANIPGAVLAIQSEGRGNDDSVFYSSNGFGTSAVPIKHLLEFNKPSVVVSVRLHGALQSIIDGIPTIHLSYERKGFGAYSDLGIMPWVHNAFDFKVENIVNQVSELRSDPSGYWLRIRKSIDFLKRFESDLKLRILGD